MSTVGYLSLLGLSPDLPPTVETLTTVHRAHLGRIPYDNLDIVLERPPSIVPSEVLRRILRVGRAGYCFHHNGALGQVLIDLGFDVSRWSAQVWGRADERSQHVLNHLALVVGGLPTAGNPSGSWWVDAGLGEGPYGPVPLVEGVFTDGPFRFELSRLPGGGWSCANDPGGTFRGVDLRPEAPGLASVTEAHTRLSTPPGGAFATTLVVARRTATGCDIVRGCVATRRDARGVHWEDVATYDSWRAALGVLALPLDDLDEDELQRLFARSLAAHRTWDRAGRP